MRDGALSPMREDGLSRMRGAALSRMRDGGVAPLRTGRVAPIRDCGVSMMPAKGRSPMRDGGVSMIEMVVAVLVLSIAVVGLFRVFDASLAGSAGQRDRALAMIVAQNRAESIALGLRDPGPDVVLAGRDWTVETRSTATAGGFAQITIRVAPSEGGAGIVLTTYGAGSGAGSAAASGPGSESGAVQ